MEISLLSHMWRNVKPLNMCSVTMFTWRSVWQCFSLFLWKHCYFCCIYPQGTCPYYTLTKETKHLRLVWSLQDIEANAIWSSSCVTVNSIRNKVTREQPEAAGGWKLADETAGTCRLAKNNLTYFLRAVNCVKISVSMDSFHCVAPAGILQSSKFKKKYICLCLIYSLNSIF